MKPLVIAATTLALAGAAFAQSETVNPATQPDQVVQDTAGAAADAANDAADAAAVAADDAANAAADAADAAAGAGEAAADMADQAADDAAAEADAAADAAGDMAGEAAAVPVTPPDVNPPAISEADPGLLGSWLTSRRIWTTNQPSTTEWTDPGLGERPVEWLDIAKVNDIVLDDTGQVVGYIADIGGFLGIGAKKVLLGKDAIHLISVGSDTFFATNYTKAELQALPDFDAKTVRQ